MIALSVLGRWADRPKPLSTDLAAVNLDSFQIASEAALPKRGTSKRGSAKSAGPKAARAKPPVAPKQPKAPRPVKDAPPRTPTQARNDVAYRTEPAVTRANSTARDIPVITRITPVGPSNTGSPAVSPVNINTATVAELEQLPRVGPVLAARIVAYRDANGRFANVEGLTGVKGVGPAMLERLRPYVRAP